MDKKLLEKSTNGTLQELTRGRNGRVFSSQKEVLGYSV